METLEKIIVKLLTTDGIFYASLLSQMSRYETDELPTAGVTIRNGRIELYWNPKFFEKLKMSESVAVLEHECLHLIMNHIIRKQNRDMQLWNIACAPPGTVIIGANKKIEDIKLGDTVLQSNGFGKATGVVKQQFKGQMFEFRASSCLPFQVTSNHPLLVCERKPRKPIILGTPIWKDAKNVKKDDYVLIPKIKGTVKTTSLSLSKFINDKKINNHTQSHNIVKGLKNRKFPLNEDTAWLLGLYTADGSNHIKDGTGITIALHPREIEKAQKVERIFKSFGYTVKIIPGQKIDNKVFHTTSMNVMVCSRVLGKAFREWCGCGSHNKKIPDFILSHKDLRIVKAFLDGYYDGDGTMLDKKGNRIAGTCNLSLALQVQLAILRLGGGHWAQVSKSFQRDIYNPKIKTDRVLYNICWTKIKKSARMLQQKQIMSYSSRWRDIGDYFAVPLLRISESLYDGPVFNLQTENHTFAISNIITHNTDLAINQLIKGLPGDCVTLDKFPKEWKLLPNQTAEVYYDIMEKNSPKIKITSDGSGGFNVEVKDGKGNTVGKFKLGNPGNHDKWDESDSPDISQEILKQAVKHAKEQVERGQGHMPSHIEQLIEELLRPAIIPWQHILRKFVAMSIKAGHKMSWKRPNRRYESTQKGKLPARKVALTIAIDTSGSIGDEDLNDFISEIKSIQQCYKSDVTILECDADVQKKYKLTPFSKVDTKFKGRGGTDFKPIFDYIKKECIKTDVLIYFTDMYGDFPTKAPNYPTLWVSTSDIVNAPFGTVLSIREHETADKKSKRRGW
jgi:predicted metal-dependent peptidase